MCTVSDPHLSLSLSLSLSLQLLTHVEMTSPECLLFPGQVGLCEPVPVGGGAVMGGGSSKEIEETMVKYLTEQHLSEQIYTREAFTLPRYVWAYVYTMYIMHVG